jgi:hypothetical protein
VRDLGVELRDLAGSEDLIPIAEDESQVPRQDVDPFGAVVGPRLGVDLAGRVTIFQACMPSGWRVSGMTVRPFTWPGLSLVRVGFQNTARAVTSGD